MSKKSDAPSIDPLRSTAKVFSKLKALNVRDVIVGFSGGKDSLCTLDLAVKHFGPEHVKVFFLYTLKGLQCESGLAELPTKRYGIPVIQFPLPEIVAMIREGYARSTPASLRDLLDRKYGWNEIEKLVRYKTGSRWLLYGHRQQDSLHRRGMLSRCEGVWETAYASGKPIQRAYPLWQWNHKQVFAYLEKNKLPIPHMFGSGVINTSGLSLMDADCLAYVKQHYPEDFKRLHKIFPGLETPLFRQEVLQRSFAQLDEDQEDTTTNSPMELQQTSELFETEVAKILKLTKTRNNFPVDWTSVFGRHGDLGIELKVLNKAAPGQDRVQMRPTAKKRKLEWLAQGQRTGFTVLIDNRDNYSHGKYKQHYSGHRFYLQKGFGAFRIDAMEKLKDLETLAFRLYGPEAVGLGDINHQFKQLMERTYG